MNADETAVIIDEASIVFDLVPEESSPSQSVYRALIADFTTTVYCTGTQAALGMAIDDADSEESICLDGISQVLLHPPVTQQMKVGVNLIRTLAEDQRSHYIRLLRDSMQRDCDQLHTEVCRGVRITTTLWRTHELIDSVCTCDQLITHLPEESP